jgi:hypothetical protein
MGLLEFIQNKFTVTILSLFFNMIGGIGNGLNSVATIAVLSGYKD